MYKNNEEETEETTMLPASDENPEESSNAASDLVSNQNLANVLQSEDRKDSNVSELPESTENQDVYMYFRGSGKAAEMKREAAKRTMMAALP